MEKEMTFEDLRAELASKLDFWLSVPPSRGSDPVRSAAFRRRARILAAQNKVELEACFIGFP